MDIFFSGFLPCFWNSQTGASDYLNWTQLYEALSFC